jgi:hypothetical protein
MPKHPTWGPPPQSPTSIGTYCHGGGIRGYGEGVPCALLHNEVATVTAPKDLTELFCGLCDDNRNRDCSPRQAGGDGRRISEVVVRRRGGGRGTHKGKDKARVQQHAGAAGRKHAAGGSDRPGRRQGRAGLTPGEYSGHVGTAGPCTAAKSASHHKPAVEGNMGPWPMGRRRVVARVGSVGSGDTHTYTAGGEHTATCRPARLQVCGLRRNGEWGGGGGLVGLGSSRLEQQLPTSRERACVNTVGGPCLPALQCLH